MTTHIKTYRMQLTGANGKTVRTSVPSETVEAEAARIGITIDAFVKQYRIRWFWGEDFLIAEFVSKGSV